MRIYWAGIAIGLIVGFYWARVLKLVYKARKTTGRSANFVPPEALGRALRVLWYPNVALWIAVPFLVALIKRRPRLIGLLYDEPIAAWAAVIVAALAMYGTLVCWRRMGKSWRMGIDPGETTQLVFTGPYAYVRHPIYALQSLLVLASVGAVPAPGMIIVAVIQLTFLQWEARREEMHLVRIHGTGYANYLDHVGRFLPRSLNAYVPIV